MIRDHSTAETICEPVAPRISRIGLVAYCALPPNYVFVRVPNEPGRWLITHRCVVEVECTYCKAVCGEPCKNTRSMHYSTYTHTYRRASFRMRDRRRALDQHKPHLSMTDLRDVEQLAPEEAGDGMECGACGRMIPPGGSRDCGLDHAPCSAAEPSGEYQGSTTDSEDVPR